jgi:hypothetical protein
LRDLIVRLLCPRFLSGSMDAFRAFAVSPQYAPP